MSPLWRSNTDKQLKTIHKRPSPKHSKVNQSLARGLIFRKHRQFPQQIIFCNAIKGISLFISHSRKITASMTVEAAVVLPLFLFFFLNMSCAIEFIRLHGNLELALWDVGSRMAVYGYTLSEDAQENEDRQEYAVTGHEQTETKKEETEETEKWWAELADIAFSYTYVKNEIVKYVGSSYLDEAPIVNGVDGLQFWESEIFTKDDFVEIIVTYRTKPFSSIVGFKPFRMANRYYGHLWTGYRIPGTDTTADTEDCVYITENGVVYHEDPNCSHLALSIQEVSLRKAYESRNANGEKYIACSLCGKRGDQEGVSGKQENGGILNGMNLIVYITEDGNSIHYTRDCSGLKRTVYAVIRKEAENYRPCQRCANG